jgi:hypothetical protein
MTPVLSNTEKRKIIQKITRMTLNLKSSETRQHINLDALALDRKTDFFQILDFLRKQKLRASIFSVQDLKTKKLTTLQISPFYDSLENNIVFPAGKFLLFHKKNDCTIANFSKTTIYLL